jgi:hypothetical protein
MIQRHESPTVSTCEKDRLWVESVKEHRPPLAHRAKQDGWTHFDSVKPQGDKMMATTKPRSTSWKHYDMQIPCKRVQSVVYKKNAQWKHYDFCEPKSVIQPVQVNTKETSGMTSATTFTTKPRRTLSLPSHLIKIQTGKPLFWFLPSHRRTLHRESLGIPTETAPAIKPSHRKSLSESCIDMSTSWTADLETVSEDGWVDQSEELHGLDLVHDC